VLAAAIALPPLYYAAFPEPAPELPPAGRRIEVSPGICVNAIESGSGEPVVLVHGHPGCSYDWALVLDALSARGRHAIAYDRVGYGRSDARPPGHVRVSQNADDLLALLAALDLRDVTLVGHSYGGATSIVAAKRNPSRIARLVLVGSVGPGVEKLRPTVPGPIAEILAGPVLSWVASVPPAWSRFGRAFSGVAFDPAPVPDWFRVQAAANFAMPHTLDAFRSEGRDLGGEVDLDPQPIALPIAILHGADDRLVPFPVAEALAARAPHAKLARIEHAGHMLPITHVELVADAITADSGRPR
jgi:pimeloyl-ACP methyl ester carboxylesterase